MRRAADRAVGVVLGFACAALFLSLSAHGQDEGATRPVRPDAPSVARPDAPTPPSAADDPAAPEGESTGAASSTQRAPVTYWDEYQKAADEAEASAAAGGTDGEGAFESSDTDESGDESEIRSLWDDAEQAPTFLENVLRLIFWFCVLLAAYFFVLYIVRNVGQRARLLPQDSLGTVIGRLYLAPRYSLHFVKTGGRVLVVGITPNEMRLIAEFDDDAFPVDEAPASSNGAAAATPGSREKAVRFLEELKLHQNKLTVPEPKRDKAKAAPSDGNEDEEIQSLRGDIARLQQILRDSANDPPQ